MIIDLNLNRFCSDGQFEFLVDDHKNWIESKGVSGDRLILQGIQIGGIWQSDIDLSNSIFTDCEFEDSPVEYVNFTNAIFTRCNFEGTKFNNCIFTKTVFRDCINVPKDKENQK